MVGCILHKVQRFVGGGEVVVLCMSIHALPIKSLQASELNLRLKKRSTNCQKTFQFGLNPDNYNHKCSNNRFITTGQTSWYKIKCMGLITVRLAN